MRTLMVVFLIDFFAIVGFSQVNGTFTDPRDGKIYKTVKIGSQTWMAENLAYLPQINASKDGSDNEPRYYVYGFLDSDIALAKKSPNFIKYGVLYNWHAAMLSCPKGWHLPTDEEWKQLEMELGLSQASANSMNIRGKYQGTGLKSKSGWLDNGNGDDSYGMNCLPAGNLCDDHKFRDLGEAVSWWTSTHFDSEYFSLVRMLTSDDYGIIRGNNSVAYGLSVRCVKD